MPMLESALRLLFDAAEINAFVTARDGALCGVPLSRFLIMLHEVIEIHRNWKMVLQIQYIMIIFVLAGSCSQSRSGTFGHPADFRARRKQHTAKRWSILFDTKESLCLSALSRATSRLAATISVGKRMN
jgi:hypothetical protein